MIIDKNSEYIELYKINGECRYDCGEPIETEEDIVIDLDYPIYFRNWIITKGQIKSNVTITSNYVIKGACGIDVTGDITGSTIVSNGNIRASGNIKAYSDILSGGSVEAGGCIDVWLFDLRAGGDVTAGDYIKAGDKICAEGKVTEGRKKNDRTRYSHNRA